MTPLSNLTHGQMAMINHIDDSAMALLALRFGIQSGSQVTLLRKIPSGPMVFQYGYGELALGKEVCEQITATLLPSQANQPQQSLKQSLKPA
jgi:Fe2+ transport system protein FeoA